MRFSKKYFAFALALVLTLAWKLNTWHDQYAVVETFRGADLQENVFYPLMSKNINDSGDFTAYINDSLFANNDGQIMLDNTLRPVASLDFISDVMYGSVCMEPDQSVVLQIVDDIYEFLVDNSTANLNGDDYDLKAAPSIYNGKFYIGLDDLCTMFGYDYYYDSESYDLYIAMDERPALPKLFDLRESDKVSEIRNQGSASTCWACASLEALESSLLPSQNFIFSVDAMTDENNFKIDKSVGGDYTMALAYLLSWKGPVIEKNNASLLPDLGLNTNDDAKPSIHLQEVQFYDAEELDRIKWAVYRYGGVSTSIYASVSTSNLSESSSYNRRTNSYCYLGNNKPNHDVVIIGWDDTYPASAFSANVPGNGAFICQNSWGTGFGDNGVFYISYYDTNVGNQAVSYTKVDTTNKYNYIYQSDLCGWVGQVGYNKEWMYGANLFTAEGEQQIEAAGFYALGDNTSYQLYFVHDYNNIGSLANRELVAEGQLDAAGYYTIPFNSAKSVNKDECFGIILYINTPDNQRPMAIEYTSESMTEPVDLTDGKGFISNNGLDWENVENVANANLCIKAYGNNVVKVFE